MKKKVVAYARVSTTENKQALSIENQKSYFQRVLEKDKSMKFIKINIPNICDNGIYYDNGVSGTKLKRPGFDRMLIDAGLQPVVDAETDKKTTLYKVVKKPKFDMIYVKDTTRFARNVNVNSILQALKDNNVYVYFLELGKSTESNEDMTFIQIFFSFAERESRDKSKKVKFGYEEGIRKGKIYVGGKMIGYDYDKSTNSLRINPKEAELVKLVYNLYTEEGLGHQMICNRLADMGYFNSKGNKYTRSTISRMLENEKYTGITNTGIYTKDDLFSKQHKRDYNDPLRQDARKAQQDLLEKGIVKIEPIITVEQFKKAENIRKNNCIANGVDGTYHGTTDYARKIKCGCCGSWYIAHSRKYDKKHNIHIRYYACSQRFAYDEYNNRPKCNTPSIREDKLDKLINSEMYYNQRLQVVKSLIEMSDFYLKIMSNYLDFDAENAIKVMSENVNKLKTKRSRLLDLYADGIFNKTELEDKTNKLTNEINRLSDNINELSMGNNAIYNKISQIEEIRTEACNELNTINKYIETQRYPEINRRALLRDIDYITIKENGKIEFTYKSISAIKETILLLGQDQEMYEELDNYDEEEPQ